MASDSEMIELRTLQEQIREAAEERRPLRIRGRQQGLLRRTARRRVAGCQSAVRHYALSADGARDLGASRHATSGAPSESSPHAAKCWPSSRRDLTGVPRSAAVWRAVCPDRGAPIVVQCAISCSASRRARRAAALRRQGHQECGRVRCLTPDGGRLGHFGPAHRGHSEDRAATSLGMHSAVRDGSGKSARVDDLWATRPLPLSATAWYGGVLHVRLAGAEAAVRAACEG